jgi:hypothetical protein
MIERRDNGHVPRPRTSPRNWTQLCAVLANSFVLDTAGTGCGVTLKKDRHPYKIGARC